MAETALGFRPTLRFSIPKLLAYSLGAVVAIHVALLLVLGSHSVAASRLATATIPMLAALSFLWRAQRLADRDRRPWRLLSLSVLLWAAGQVVETFIGQSAAASNLSIDASDFLYITASFPVLLAISKTRETESLRFASFLDAIQIGLAFVLTWVLLFRMQFAPGEAATVMGRIYGVECSLLAVFAIFRLVTWATLEERRRIRTLCAVVWLYLPIELGMDYATRRWNLRAGSLLDLLWSVPFLYAAWQALHMPTEESSPTRTFGRARLLVESLCPALVTAAVLSLAASIFDQHSLLALTAIFLLFGVQTLHSSVLQINYLSGQRLLLERERQLQDANANLERISLLDPLTGIPNRRRFTSALEDAWRRGLRSKGPLAVLMIDIDFFKGINDLRGHAYGDQCLASIAHSLSLQVRRTDDLLARYGGEEFVLLLPETDEPGALIVAERMRAAVALLDLPNQASPFNARLTLSIGIATLLPAPGTAPTALVDLADQALYEAKRLGRNRICTRSHS